jgi:hypothetical protein
MFERYNIVSEVGLEKAEEELAVEHGNRTRQGRLSAPLTGFEDRAGHQARMLYRAGV